MISKIINNQLSGKKLKKFTSKAALAALTLFISQNTFALDIAQECETNTSLMTDYDAIHQIGDVRVFYTKTGTHSISWQTDSNNNNIPDYVENVATQYHATDMLLKSIGFRPPKESVRYVKGKTFDIHIRQLSNNYTVTQSAKPIKYTSDVAESCGLPLYLSNTKSIGIENATTLTQRMLRNYIRSYMPTDEEWFIVGIADWANSSTQLSLNGMGWNTPLPTNQTELENVLNMVGTASRDFWSRFFYLLETQGAYSKLPALFATVTYTSGKSAVRDGLWSSHKYLIQLLQLIDESDNSSTSTGSQAATSSKALQAAKRILRRSTDLSESAEVKSFLSL